MKITANTLNVLKSFTQINPSIMINSGNLIKTISPSKTILGLAEVDDTFEQDFAIYDLNQFLSAVSLFDNPDYIFEDKSVTIANGKSSVEYYFCSSNMIMQVPEKEIVLPDVVVEFDLPESVLKPTMQAANVFQAPNWCVVGDGKNIFLEVTDVKNPTSNKYRTSVGETDSEFNLVFKVDNLRIMSLDYNVKISSKNLSQFVSEKGKVKYYIAMESG